jgi:hypothetical protein
MLDVLQAQSKARAFVTQLIEVYKKELNVG